MKKRYDAKFKTKVVLEALREYIHVRETGCPFSYILEVSATPQLSAAFQWPEQPGAGFIDAGSGVEKNPHPLTGDDLMQNWGKRACTKHTWATSCLVRSPSFCPHTQPREKGLAQNSGSGVESYFPGTLGSFTPPVAPQRTHRRSNLNTSGASRAPARVDPTRPGLRRRLCICRAALRCESPLECRNHSTRPRPAG